MRSFEQRAGSLSGAPHQCTHACAGEGKYAVSLLVFDTGAGFVASLTGGEAPHVGGVILATPRPSISGSGEPSCDIYSIPVTSHLDNEVGRDVATMLCRATGQVVSLTSGIHIDNATPQDLTTIAQNVHSAAKTFLDRHQGTSQSPSPRA